MMTNELLKKMTTSGKLEYIKDLICTAYAAQRKADATLKSLFDTLIQLDIDLDVESNAENADNLNDAICCYIDYNEYNLDRLLEEIKSAMLKITGD